MERQYHKSIFAFLDLLGAKENIKRDDGKFLNKLGSIYESTLNIYKDICDPTLRENIHAKIFSDNIVFECEIKDGDGFNEFKEVAFITAIFQEELLRSNLLLRGGITIGDSYLDDILVFGNALNEAYLLVDKIAIYPRVILSKELAQIICSKVSSLSPIAYICAVDRDGEYYIDYLSSSGRNPTVRIPLIKSAIEYNNDELKRENYDSRVKQKLLWHNDYLQMKLKQFKNHNE